MPPLGRFDWSRLNRHQVGRYAEYFVKMEFTMHGFQVYTAEVDDRGIDFVARHGQGQFFEVQVKSLRDRGYIFIQKEKTRLSDDRLAAVVLFTEGKAPDLFLIPMTAWKTPNALLVDHDYGSGKKSKPEFGINLSTKNRELLEPYRFHTVIGQLTDGSGSPPAGV